MMKLCLSFAKKNIFVLPFLLACISFAFAGSSQPEHSQNITRSQVTIYFSQLVKDNLLISLFVSYFFGKGVEFFTNEYLKIGWRVIDFNVEIFNFISHTHSSVIFAENLDIFTKNKKLNKFIKSLKRRSKLESAKKLTIIYQPSEESENNLKVLEGELQTNNMSNKVDFVAFSQNFPQVAFFGEREFRVKIPFYKLALPRFYRYAKKKYFSGIHTDVPFITKTDADHYKLLKKYTEVILKNEDKE